MNNRAPHTHPTEYTYLIGFLLSLGCSLLAFGIADLALRSSIHLAGNTLYFLITTFALSQLAIQSYFFLHLSRNARFNLLAFIFTIYTVAFIVIGSLWILKNLDQNMTHEEVSSYMHKQN